MEYEIRTPEEEITIEHDGCIQCRQMEWRTPKENPPPIEWVHFIGKKMVLSFDKMPVVTKAADGTIWLYNATEKIPDDKTILYPILTTEEEKIAAIAQDYAGIFAKVS